jgi:autotransporter-associated beta strand protein
VAAVTLSLPAARAATAYFSYDGVDGAAESWTAGGTNWGTTSGTWSGYGWVGYDQAVFEGTGGLVNASSILANTLTFNVAGYTLAGSVSFGDPRVQNLTVASGISAAITANLTAAFTTGLAKTGAGTAVLSGTNSISVGFLTVSNGILEISGGTTTSSAGLSVSRNSFQTNDGVLSTLRVTGGALNITGGNFFTGRSTNGGVNVSLASLIEQTGGSITYGGSSLNLADGGGVTRLDLSGGTFTSTTATMLLGVRGGVTLNISGTAVVNLPSIQYFHSDAVTGTGRTSTINLNGGTLVVGNISSNSTPNTSNLVLNGGLLQARSNATINANLTSITVGSGGARFDTNGFDVTVGRALVAASGSSGGLTKDGAGTLTLGAVSTFTGATVVNSGTLTYSLGSAATLSLPSDAGLSGAGSFSATAGLLKINGNMTLGGSISLTQTGGGSLYSGIELASAASTLTATAISLSGDIGKRDSNGNTLTLDTSAANGTINLNVSLGRSGIWYVPTSLVANAGTGTINVTGTGGGSDGWRSTPVSLTGSVNISGNVRSDAALTVNSGATTGGVVTGALSGGMWLTKTGTGKLTISGANTNTGQFLLKAGTLEMAGGSWTGGSNGTQRALNIGVATGDVATFTLSSGALNLSTGNANNGILVGDAGNGTFNQTGGTVTTGGGGIWVADGGTGAVGVVNLSGGTFDATGGATIIGTRGTATLNVSGTANVSLGSLQLGHSAGGASVAKVNLDGGTLAVTAVTRAAGTANLYFNGGTLRARASTTTFLQGLNSAEVKAGGAVFDTAGFNITVGQALVTHATSTGGGLTKNGAGTLTLGAVGTFTGNTVVNAGTLAYSLGSGGTLDLPSGAGLSGAGSFSAAGGYLKIRGDMTMGGAISLSQVGSPGTYLSGIQLDSSVRTLTASSITLSGDLGTSANGSGLILDTSASNGTINLNVSLGRDNTFFSPSSFVANAGTGTINVTGTGGGSNGWKATPVSLTGSVNISGNVLSDAALTVNSGATTSGAISGALSGGMSLTKAGSGSLLLTGANTYTGATTVSAGQLVGNSSSLQGAITNNAAVTFDQVSDGTYAGLMSGTGSLTKAGVGILTLSAANNFSGGVFVEAGSLRLGHASALGSGTVIVSGGVLDLNGFALDREITLSGGRLTGLANVSAAFLDLSTDTPAVSGSVAGILNLAGKTVDVTGGLTATGTLKGDGATFSGGVVTLGSNATHAPGDSPGSQTFEAGLAYSSTWTLEWEIDLNSSNWDEFVLPVRGVNFDAIDVTGGDLTITAGAILSLGVIDILGSGFADAFWDEMRQFSVISFTSSGQITGVFTLDTSNVAGLAAGRGQWSLLNDTSGISLQWTPVPEPSTYGLILGGLALAGAALRRRRSRA